MILVIVPVGEFICVDRHEWSRARADDGLIHRNDQMSNTCFWKGTIMGHAKIVKLNWIFCSPFFSENGLFNFPEN